ncbi:MAG: hypothetical protein ACREUW_19060 [Burkholderiales bacterium]
MPPEESPPRGQPRLAGPAGNLLTRIVGFVAGVALLVAGFMFSLALFGALIIIGLGVWVWFWWKTRALRRHLREQMEAQGGGTMSGMRDDLPPGGRIIEGEVIRDPAAPPRRE